MSQRKTDHINMAAMSAPSSAIADERFYYEPLLNTHPTQINEFSFLGQTVKFPLWISSMTGGAPNANRINRRLATAAAKYGLGMGLGSCRSLLSGNEYFDDFNLRSILGKELPLYANLGIAQIERLIGNNEVDKIDELLFKLDANGLVIHINPAQEWLQPEGDRFTVPPLVTIQNFIEAINGRYKIIVKEVGQGMGPQSLQALLSLKVDGIELAAYGGTNFASIEIMRNNNRIANSLYPIANVGHNANEMIEIINNIVLDQTPHCKLIIASGGIKNFLDGYYLTKKCALPSVYGMAGTMLQHALESEEDLFDFIETEIKGYMFATSYLRIKK